MQNEHPSFLPLSQAKHILSRAFLLAQGNEAIQVNLFRYLALAQPNRCLKDALLDDLTQQVNEASRRFLAQSWHGQLPTHIPVATQVQQEARQAVLLLQDTLNHPVLQRETLLSSLWVDILHRDYLFLVVRGGRPREKPSHVAASPAAAFFSHVCQYAFLHISVGLAEFDQAFREIDLAFRERSAVFRRGMAQPEVPGRLERVIAVHNQHYPHTPVALPQF